MYIDFESPDQLANKLAALSDPAAPPLWLVLLADRHGETLGEIAAHLERAGLQACGGVFPGLIDGVDVRHSGAIAVTVRRMRTCASAGRSGNASCLARMGRPCRSSSGCPSLSRSGRSSRMVPAGS